MHCKDCRRPMPHNRVQCVYCGGSPEKDAPGFRAPLCLSCKGVMKSHPDYEKAVLQCKHCKSLWFGVGVLERMLAELEVEVELRTSNDPDMPPVVPPKRKPQPVEYRRCPSCDMPMKRENYKRISGIIIDRCLQHGTYLDGGELEALMEFMKAGGQAAADFHDETIRRGQTEKRARDAVREKERAKRARLRASAGKTSMFRRMPLDGGLWDLLTGGD